MQYLVERYDTEYKISFPKGTREYYEMNNWLFFMNAGVGPMQGQASKSESFICHEGNEAMERIDSPVCQRRRKSPIRHQIHQCCKILHTTSLKQGIRPND